MSWVILDTSDLGDDVRHAPKRPEVGRESMRLSPLTQGGLDLKQLLLAQPGSTTRAASPLQALAATTPE
jgi:hypothetical protein